jgi:hypothetical protein
VYVVLVSGDDGDDTADDDREDRWCASEECSNMDATPPWVVLST